jgi:glycosyltransferase involved in cell wall biosynthesis
MQSGCPAIVSRQPSIAEVTGDGALGLDATDAKSWAEAMTAFLTSDELRCSWRDRGLRRAAEFSWDQTARKTREVYVEARRRY